MAEFNPFAHEVKVGLAFCTPIPMIMSPAGELVLERISPLWHRRRMALMVPTNFNQIEMFIDGLEIGKARTRAAERLLEHDPHPRFLFFLDYDVLPEHDALVKLLYRAETHPEHDIYAGVYCSKSPSICEPLIYSGNGGGCYWDWAVGDILTTEQNKITAVHMGLTLVRTSLFEKMENTEEKPFFMSPHSTYSEKGFLKTHRGTEDIYFCSRAIKEVNASILVDTSVLAPHIDPATGKPYGLPPDSPPVLRAKWRDTGIKPVVGKKLKKAIDLGAGSDINAEPERRQWPGYKTETLDIRPGPMVDYVQDLRKLNLLDKSYDLVASRHTLEHIARWEQEKVWSEMFRILKPDGLLEIIVPNIEWAAQKIAMGDCDLHVMNVLYGSQEVSGYARQYNTHFFGYTPQILQALAEGAGFTDIRVEHYKNRPELTYHMVLHARKPKADESNGSSKPSPRKTTRKKAPAKLKKRPARKKPAKS